ncbi:MAG: hypothetical protein KQH63_04150 [Desulfobulbaceae bacterium]|nr:hypothetical protein [Desulfobulbaceae bacterium]
MKRFFFFPVVLLLFATMITLASCSSKNKPGASTDKLLPINSLIVMPVAIDNIDHGHDYSTTRQLDAGSQIITGILQNKLAERKGTTFLSASQKEALMGNFAGSAQAVALHVGSQAGADAVLITTLNRYQDREGRDRSVSHPASVAFQYQLLHVKSGRNLCFGKFDETQQPLFANLFSFSKAYKRGFKWVSAERITKDGFDEKFEDCLYLAE